MTSKATRVGQGLCLLGAALGAMGLVGWVTGAMELTFIIPGEPQMKPNTAMALVLVGVASVLRTGRAPARTAVSLVIALVVLAIGAGTLAEYLLGVDLRIDQLVLAAADGPFPGRPSPPTALALTLLAAGLFLFDVRPTTRALLSEALVLAAGLIALTALAGLAFGAGPLYRLESASVTGVALPTGLSVLATSVGLLLELPPTGLMGVARSSGPGGSMMRRLLGPTLLAPACGGFLLLWGLIRVGLEDLPLVVAFVTVLMASGGLFVLVVTARRLDQEHEALQRSQARARELVEQASEGIFVADLSGRYTDVNSAGSQMLGYSREEIVGKTILDLIPADEVPRLLASKEAMLTGGSNVAEWRLLRKDGAYLPVEVSAKILPDGRWQGFVRDISERQRGEAALRLAEAKASGIVSTSADAIISIDERQRIQLFNEGAQRIFGYAKEEVLGAPLDVLLPESLRAVHRRHVEKFAAGQQISRRMGERGSQILGRRKSGEEFPADAAISKLEVGGQKLLTVALRDVSDRKRAEDQLRQVQERYELALKGADLATWDWHVKTGEVIFNPRWAQMRGYDPSEVAPHVDSWISGVHPEDWAGVQRALDEHLRGRAPAYEARHRVRTKSGSWIWILDRGRVFSRDEQGNPVRMVGTELDITESRQIEQEHAFLAEVGPAVASTLDFDEVVTRLGRLALQGLADISIVALLDEGGALHRLKVETKDSIPPWIGDALRSAPRGSRPASVLDAAVRTRQPILIERVSSEEVSSLAQSDEQLQALRAANPESVIAVPLIARGKAIGAMALISTSNLRIYGAAELHLADELARRSAVSIENAQLYRAAESAIRARDDVLGIVAHDLRNPLGSILLQVGLLRPRGRQMERRSRRPAEVIERAATRMNRLIQDVLDVTSLDAGRLAIRTARIAPAQVVAEALETQRSLASAGTQKLRSEVAQDLPEVRADRDRLLQVFENLLGNALKFTGPGGHVAAGAAPRNGDVMFWVEDTGSGIPADHLPHVFDRFWQGRKTDRRGAGLGLPIVKGLVEAHGGRVWVESVEGRGTTFYFTIPAAPRTEPQMGEPAPELH